MSEWFNTLKAIVNRHDQQPEPETLARAAAVVLLELAAADDEQDESELAVIRQAIRHHFELGEQAADELIEEAAHLRTRTVSLHRFTQDLRTGLPRQTRDDLVGWLWRVAWADGRLDRHEEHLVRRVADLIGVPHDEFIRRKHQAAPDAP